MRYKYYTMKVYKVIPIITLALMVLMVTSCGGGQNPGPKEKAEAGSSPGDPVQNKGIGPVDNVVMGEFDPQMAAEGKEIYNQMCTACHKPEEKFIGPAPKGVLDRRSPEWIMNMILNPEEMVKNDPVAKQLLVEYNLAPMANQHLTEEQARKILEYFRTL